jgi:hypothetical protein
MKHFDQTIRDFAMDVFHRYKEDKPVTDNKPKHTTVNIKMEESVLNKITTSNWCYYFEAWRNGKKGGFVQKQGIYRFHEKVRNKGGNLDDVYDKEEDNPIVAIGIVAYWLIFNSRKDDVIKRLTNYRVEIPKDIKEQFENYTKVRFEQFKNDHRDDPFTWDWDWEYVFYTKYIIPHEIELNKMSEALFDYISDSDIALVRAVMNNYIKYLKKCRTEKGYRVSPELLVLRSIDTLNEFALEDLEDYEINTILDRLESEGYVKVAWVEGHSSEGVRLLDKGRTYLKQLEENVRNTIPPLSESNIKPKDNNSITNKEQNTPPIPDDNTERQIDIERLKVHFKISFQRNGFETLISMLKIKHDPKGFAMIANQIYISKHFRKEDFNSFSAWYRAFCELVGCKYCGSYKPNKLKPTKVQEASFLFLK